MAGRLAEAYLGRLPHRAQLRAQEGECRLRSTAQSSFGGTATKNSGPKSAPNASIWTRDRGRGSLAQLHFDKRYGPSRRSSRSIRSACCRVHSASSIPDEWPTTSRPRRRAPISATSSDSLRDSGSSSQLTTQACSSRLTTNRRPSGVKLFDSCMGTRAHSAQHLPKAIRAHTGEVRQGPHLSAVPPAAIAVESRSTRTRLEAYARRAWSTRVLRP
jgi:hypothetical protein